MEELTILFNPTDSEMDEFERWFLIAYTAYFIAALAALLWVADDKAE
jgi:hypothetical protein